MFQVKDLVLYGTEGICMISDIVTKDFSGEQVTYYVLSPVYHPASTIFVPVDNEALTRRMRRALCADEVMAVIRSMPAAALLWIENENERKETYKKILSEGNRKEMIQMIKALYQHQIDQQSKGKKLHIADERFFKEAERMLCDEFAMALKVEREQVMPLIFETLAEAEKKPS